MIPTHIVIHHSLTVDGKTVSWGAIRKYHTQTNGWQDIGYHFGVELIDDTYEILVGRESTDPGAHCKENGMNSKSLGICVVGNFDLAPPPPAQMDKLVKHVKSLMQQWGIPKANIHRHHDFSAKSCPGNQFPWDQFMAQL